LVKKHLEIQNTDASLEVTRKHRQIEAEAALDGIYILRTSVAESQLSGGMWCAPTSGLKEVERASRTLKDPELEIRPIHHHLENRVRARRRRRSCSRTSSLR